MWKHCWPLVLIAEWVRTKVCVETVHHMFKRITGRNTDEWKLENIVWEISTACGPWPNIIHCHQLLRVCRHLYDHVASSQVISPTPSAGVPWQPGLYCHNNIWNSKWFMKPSGRRVALPSGCVAVSLNIKTRQELCCEASCYSPSALGFAYFAIYFGRFAADIITTVVFHTVNANWSSKFFFVFIKTYHLIHETRCQNSIPLFSARKKALASVICCSVLILLTYFSD